VLQPPPDAALLGGIGIGALLVGVMPYRSWRSAP
jgi:hypothetical protein